ncbi:MAG: helix-turn-helix domain-containing protein [Oscillospiraceae bacterium]|nr:helix-turn-helix domain-containing protein [Oscillospiraceae bacterium]MCL2159984.1 helix-turn-helix domain-containing protein [Oscillospiraceae bacterium]
MQKQMSFGDFIRQKRLEREKLQADIAKALDISISFVSEMERRQRLPFGPFKLEKFADYLNLTDEEKAQMYDIASREHNEVPADIAGTLMYEDVGNMARFALREFKAGNLEEEDWKQLIRKAEENKRRKGGADE